MVKGERNIVDSVYLSNLCLDEYTSSIDGEVFREAFDLEGRLIRRCQLAIGDFSSSSLALWQCTHLPSSMGSSSGTLSMQICWTYLHRGWNLQPEGGSIRLGTFPGITESFSLRNARWGTEVSRASVYGCFGFRNTCSTVPVSHTWPAYSTVTRSQVSATIPMSCVISIIDRFSFSFSVRKMPRIWAWIVTSSAVVGSSAINR